MLQACDLEEVLDTFTFYSGHAPHTTDTKGMFARVADFQEGSIFPVRFSDASQWERHPTGDEIGLILKSSVALTLKSAEQTGSVDPMAGMIAIVPQNTWYQFSAPDGVNLMTMTPQPAEYIEAAEPPL